MRPWKLVLPLVTVGCCLETALVNAQDFRVETDLFVGDAKEPAVENLTIFSSGVVYDFMLTGNKEITVFDRARGRLVLLDPERRIKTTLSTDSMLGFIARMKAHLIENKKGFLADPQFQQDWDPDQRLLTLSSPQLTYKVQGSAPQGDSAAENYQQFADWYARLNAMRPGNVPPFARIRLNQELASKGLIPHVVERTIVTKRRRREVTQKAQTRHLVNWRLSQTDRKWIDKASIYMASFETVRFTEYLGVPHVASK